MDASVEDTDARPLPQNLKGFKRNHRAGAVKTKAYHGATREAPKTNSGIDVVGMAGYFSPQHLDPISTFTIIQMLEKNTMKSWLGVNIVEFLCTLKLLEFRQRNDGVILVAQNVRRSSSEKAEIFCNLRTSK
ncbi:hypothetical protein YC2023_086880 [Brassica napus]